MSLLLKKPFFETTSNKELAEQIESKKKCKKKLPKWFGTPQIYYPKKLNIEQTSSERTARYKSEIVSGKTLVDLTGGFGVDSYFFSLKMESVFHCEIDSELAEIASYNFKVLGAKNVTSVSGDGIQFLEKTANRFDWIYLDPSRRNKSKEKVFHLSDCLPDVIKHSDLLLEKAENILLKTAPLLDISLGLTALLFVKEIHVVAVQNEVKELLWVVKKDFQGEVQIKTVNIQPEEIQIFDFILPEEKSAFSRIAAPLTYLYEPNTAILKSGAFKLVGSRFSLSKIHQHTHLYTSEKLIDFPGRRFKIEKYLRYNKKSFKTLNITKANITTRNFPHSVAEIRKKFKIENGGEVYLFFTKDSNENNTLLVCSKL